MLGGSAGPGRGAAAAYLRELLLRPGAYRLTWEQHVIRVRRGTINQLAVAEVLARHLRASPRTPSDATVTPLQLKDTVSRALSGQVLSRASLAVLVDAFAFSPDERDRLWRLWSGSAMISVLVGSHAVLPQAEQSLAEVLGPRQHQTVSMHDHVRVGADGRLNRTRTIQVIEATAARVDRFPFLYDTSALTLEVGLGGRGLSGQLHQVGPDVFATHILLARELELGDTITLEYFVTYRLPGDLSDPGEREYRRGVLGSMQNYDMRIEFDPARRPARLCWATWDGVEGPVVDEVPVTLDSQHSAQRYLRSLQRTVVGFRWTW